MPPPKGKNKVKGYAYESYLVDFFLQWNIRITFPCLKLHCENNSNLGVDTGNVLSVYTVAMLSISWRLWLCFSLILYMFSFFPFALPVGR